MIDHVIMFSTNVQPENLLLDSAGYVKLVSGLLLGNGRQDTSLPSLLTL